MAIQMIRTGGVAPNEDFIQSLIDDINKRVSDKILEQSNADLLIKLIKNADSLDEAINIASLGTTYKKTGLHFDKRLEKMSNTINYFKKNEDLSFHTDDSKPTNKLIIGDNYQALQNLLIQYKNKINVIYIDPPYGKDSMGEFAKTNYNNAITRDNLLSMLYPRLQLAKQLLSDDGVIFCSIDDKNQAYVKCLFDEVFGEDNFIGCLPRLTKKGGKSSDNIQDNHDYILIFGDKKNAHLEHIEHTDIGFKHSDEYENVRGKYKLNQTLDYDTLGYVNSLDYPISINNKVYYPGNVTEEEFKLRKKENPKDDFRWRWSEKLFEFGYKNGFIVVNEKTNRIYTKTYQNATISEDDNDKYFVEITPRKKALASIDFINNEYSNDIAKKEVKNILGKFKFDYPKSYKMIQDLIKRIRNKEALILDFFAGSGTTGHAVLDLNKQDGGNRTFILCQLNEKTETTPNGIAYDVTSKRLKRVMTGECYDGTKEFKWIEKNEAYGGNLDVYEIESVANFESTEGKTPFEVIDETLYGKEKFSTVKEKIDWVCSNFEKTQKYLDDVEN